MKLFGVWIGLVLILLFLGIFSLPTLLSPHEEVFDIATVCEARGGAWVHDAERPLCMTKDAGLLEYSDGEFISFVYDDSARDVWRHTPDIPVFAPTEESEPHQLASCDDLEDEPEMYSGRIARVDFSSWPDASKYKTAITKDMARGVNFAGSYVVSTWGCGRRKGDVCVGHAVIDAKTGKILLYDVVGNRTGEFSLDSNVFSVELQSGEYEGWAVVDHDLVSCM